MLKKICYEIVSNIRFYDLLTDKCIKKRFLDRNINQQLFTTLDITSFNIIQIQMLLTNYLNKKGISHNRILCIYQDLNENIYDFINHINIKNKKNYDFYTYQRTSKSILIKAKKNIIKILKIIKGNICIKLENKL